MSISGLSNRDRLAGIGTKIDVRAGESIDLAVILTSPDLLHAVGLPARR